MDTELVTTVADEIRAGLRAAARPDKAEGMRAYLKSDLPCLGTYSDDRRGAVRAAIARHALDADTWRATIRALWRHASVREERQAAVDLLADTRTRAHRTPDALDLCRELIVEGAWWDLVDATAAAVNDILDRHRDEVTPVMRAWTREPDPWLRRVSIICQLRSRDRTDLDLLTEAIEANVADPDFFLRKAIGWALRSYARTDPGWVRTFVDTHPELSALSRREATRHL